MDGAEGRYSTVRWLAGLTGSNPCGTVIGRSGNVETHLTSIRLGYTSRPVLTTRLDHGLIA